jgi:hypothetical protein
MAAKKEMLRAEARADVLAAREEKRNRYYRELRRYQRQRGRMGVPDYGNNENYYFNENEDVEEFMMEEAMREEAEKAAAKEEALRTRLRTSQKSKKYAYVETNNANSLPKKPLGRKGTQKKGMKKGKRPTTAHRRRGKAAPKYIRNKNNANTKNENDS